jgi:hypothetical protein
MSTEGKAISLLPLPCIRATRVVPLGAEEEEEEEEEACTRGTRVVFVALGAERGACARCQVTTEGSEPHRFCLFLLLLLFLLRLLAAAVGAVAHPFKVYGGVVVYYCRTYYKAVRMGGGGSVKK